MEPLLYPVLSETTAAYFAAINGGYVGQKDVGSTDKPYQTAALWPISELQLFRMINDPKKRVVGIVFDTVYYEEGGQVKDLHITADEVTTKHNHPEWIGVTAFIAETAAGKITVLLNPDSGAFQMSTDTPDIFAVTVGFRVAPLNA
jgi:hypothetical protein